MVQSRERNWKTVMLNAITRWKYWPVSAAFQQWKQFTRVSKVARAVTRSLVSRRSEKLVSDVFYSWKYQTQLSIRARQHRVCSLLNPAIETWKQFSELHHRKSHDKRLARDFYSSRLTRVHFKAWKLRTTERFDAEARVLSSTKPLTTRDVDVMKWKVETFRRRKNERNLTESFLVWKEEYYKLHLAKRHCNRISLRRCFYAWLNCYDSYKYLESDLIRRSESHQLKRFFGEWYERTETVRMAANFHRCNEIQKLRPILQSWKLWSSGRRDERERMFRLREASRRRTIGTVFTLWRNKIQVIQLGDKYFSIGLIDRCFHDWLNLTRKRKHDRKLFDDFRTLQRKRKLRLAFSFWRKQHKLKLEVQHWKIEQRNRLVRSVGRRWKENAENRQIRREYERTIQRQVVEHWSAFVRSRLKVSCTVQRVACRWLEYTQHSRHLETLADDFCRIKSAIRLNKAFTKWKQHFHKYQVSELMYEDRLQKRVFKGWLRIIRHQKNLTLSLVAFQRKKTRQLLHTTFSVWRSEFRLLRLREEIVNDHIDKHDLNLLRQVINEWHSFTKQSKQERRILSRILEAWNIFVNGQKLRNDLMNRFVSNRLVESTFNSWNKSAERMNRAKEHHEKIVQSRVLKAWLNIVQRKQLLKNLTAQQQKTALSSAWLRWKIVFQRDRRYNELAAKLRQHHSQEVLLHYFESWLQQTYIVLLSKEQNRRSLQTSFTHWKSRVNPAQITHDREQSWGVFARQLRSDKQIQIDNIRKAVGHYQTKLCKWAFNVWQSNCNSERRRNELAFKYGLRWWRLATGPGKVYEKRRVRLMKWAWCKWRKQVIRERVSRQFYRRGQLSLLSKVFNVWRQSATTSETSRSRAQISLISSSESELAAALERMRSEMKFDAPTIFVQSASSIEDGAESPDLLDRSIESDDF
ncbi:uncharacterized protein LOC141908327 [Tubulanus polymorphus]|uniref:uncharacterized protein LOC141908327 n=1 Tax=Tubulanus polymorphus TaxID=672921 RepID=UPI003DA1FC96